jgi:hypothetical protein
MLNANFFNANSELMRSLISLRRKLRKTFPKDNYDDTLTVQHRYVEGLDHLTEFFNRVGMDEHISGKFNELAHAIWGLRNGTVATCVRPAKVGGQGPDGATAWLLRADVVIGLECILRSRKMKKQEAAEYIAKEYAIFNRLKRGPSASLPTSILSWRDRINSGKVSPGIELPDQSKFFQQHNGDDLSPTEMFGLGEEVLRNAAKVTATAAL